MRCLYLVLAFVSLSGLALADEASDSNPYLLRARQATETLKTNIAFQTAIGPVFELVGLRDRVDDSLISEPLSSLVDGGSTGKKVDPLVQAWATFHLARIKDDHGLSKEAKALRASLGLVESFWVLGPFEAQSRSSLAVPFPPELQALRPDPTTTFEGKSQTVAWRRVQDAARSGVLLLESAVAPQQEAGALLVVYVNSSKTQSAALRIGSGGPLKAWVNGEVIFGTEVQRIARMDQDAARVILKKGQNTLVIKTINLEGAWRLVVRLTAPNGEELKGVSTNLEGTGGVTLASGAAPAKRGNVRQLGTELESGWNRALKQGNHVETRNWAYSLARLWAYASPFDKDEKPIERVLNTTLGIKDDFLLRRLLGESATQENDRRSALEASLPMTTDPKERCLILSDLAELAQSGRRPLEATALRNKAIGEFPSCWPSALAQAEESRIAGLPALANLQLDRLPAQLATLPLMAKQRARVLHALGFVEKSRALFAGLRATRHTDADVMDSAVAQARAISDGHSLIALTEAMAQQRPDLLFLVLDQVKALEGQSMVDAALGVLERTLVRVPGAADIHEAKGRLLARMGRRLEAAKALSQSLLLRPQNPSLRKYMDALNKEASGSNTDEVAADLARKYSLDPWETARKALETPIPAQSPDAARVLLDRKVVHVHDNGLSEMFAQRLVHVLTDPGARENESFFIRYTPGAQEVEVRQARVFRKNPSGILEVTSATGRDDRDLSEPWYALYYDNRAEVVTFEGLRPGDVVELQYTVADVSLRNELAGYFGDFQYVAETVPTSLWQYTLVGPKGKRFYFHTPELSGFSQTQTEVGSEIQYNFQATSVHKMVPEPSMPGWAEVAPYFHVSTYENWDQVGRWYWDLVAEQLVPDSEVTRHALAAVKGKTSLEEKVKAIHKTVIQSTRYVGLEFGIHGYKPYRVSQILSRRFGDCKDKASLMVAMLKVVGIDAQMVLLRTRRGGQVRTLPASLAVFDHAIAYVPALDLYLDGTAEFSGMHELPNQDQSTVALRVWPGGSQFVHTPVLPSKTNRAVRTWDARLKEDGSAVIDESVIVVGQAAPEWRQHYQTAGERIEKYGKVWNARFPGAAVAVLSIAGVDDPNLPVRVDAKVNVPTLGELKGQHLLLPLSSKPPEYLRSYARLSKRKTDLLLAYPWQHEETLTFHFPDGFRSLRLPEPTSISSQFGTFEFGAQLAADAASVVVTSRLDMKVHRFSPLEYTEFRNFLGAAEATLRGRIELERREP
jgi:cellulose synthase operon protein C